MDELGSAEDALMVYFEEASDEVTVVTTTKLKKLEIPTFKSDHKEYLKCLINTQNISMILLDLIIYMSIPKVKLIS